MFKSKFYCYYTNEWTAFADCSCVTSGSYWSGFHLTGRTRR